jgi:hypothetical protein
MAEDAAKTVIVPIALVPIAQSVPQKDRCSGWCRAISRTKWLRVGFFADSPARNLFSFHFDNSLPLKSRSIQTVFHTLKTLRSQSI